MKDSTQFENTRTTRFAPVFRSLFWLACLGVTTVALMPVDYLPAHEPPFRWEDKALHAVAFVVLSLIGLWAYLKRPYSIILGLLVLGGVIELAQYTTGWRHMDFWDFVANAVGILVGWITFRFLHKRRIVLK